MKSRRTSRGFSLLEVVIVVAIIAILAAIGIPRMSRGSRGAGDSALRADLAVLRNAIDLYSAEHQGDYPDLANFEVQMTDKTNATGGFDASDTNKIYGPYLRSIPALPVGDRSGSTGVSDGDANGIGWIYDASTGDIAANCADTEADESGTQYNQY